MRFQVPQFIDVEDKVFGSLSFKQFVYLAGGAGISFILYVFLPKIISIPVIAAVVGLSIALAFYKVNSKPFVDTVESYLKYIMGSKLYIWKKEVRTPKPGEEEEPESALYVPKLSDSKLKEMAWNLDIAESIYSKSPEEKANLAEVNKPPTDGQQI